MNGINYGAFAAAPAIVNPLVTLLVNPGNLSPSATPYTDKTEKYFTNPVVLDNFPKIYYFAVIGESLATVLGKWATRYDYDSSCGHIYIIAIQLSY